MYVGCDNDNSRVTFAGPLPEHAGFCRHIPVWQCPQRHTALNMLKCDGSVHFINYDITLEIWRPMGRRFTVAVAEPLFDFCTGDGQKCSLCYWTMITVIFMQCLWVVLRAEVVATLG